MFDDRPLGQRAVELEVAPCYETVQLLGERARDLGHIFRLEMSFEHAIYHIRRYLDQTERTLAAASTGNRYLVSRHVHVRNGRLERLGQIIRFVVGQLVQYIARSSLFGRSGTEVNVPDLDVDALFLAQIDAQVIFRSAPRHVNGLKAQIDRPLSPRVAVAGSFLARDPGGRNRTRLHHARRGQRLGEIKLHVPYGRIAPILESQHAGIGIESAGQLVQYELRVRAGRADGILEPALPCDVDILGRFDGNSHIGRKADLGIRRHRDLPVIFRVVLARSHQQQRDHESRPHQSASGAYATGTPSLCREESRIVQVQVFHINNHNKVNGSIRIQVSDRPCK